MKSVDIAWLAGLVEGEGYIASRRGSPTIRVSMTDRDVIEKIALMFKSRVSEHQPRYHATKPVWTVTICGYTAIGWMMTLYAFLGQRRRAAVRDSIRKWNDARGHARKVRGLNGQTLPAVCHPDRPLHARQMCRQCYAQKYMRQWRADRKARAA